MHTTVLTLCLLSPRFLQKLNLDIKYNDALTTSDTLTTVKYTTCFKTTILLNVQVLLLALETIATYYTNIIFCP